MRHISCDDGGGEEGDIFHAVCLGGFGAEDGVFILGQPWNFGISLLGWRARKVGYGDGDWGKVLGGKNLS